MSVFDDRVRADCRPKRRTEDAFSFLSRSARPEVQVVRELIESWVARFPGDARADLRSRLQGSNDRAHNAALFELIVHELLVALGWEVEAHPRRAESMRSPDFLARRGDQRLFVEATAVEPKSSLFETDPLEESVFQAIDDLDSPNFFLSVRTTGKLISAPSRRTAVLPFGELMKAHDPDHVARAMELDVSSAPRLSVSHGQWTLECSLIPRSPEHRGDGSVRTIGGGPMKGGFIDNAKPVRDELHRKVTKYGALDAPFLIAVNAPDVDDRFDEMNALFGSEQVTRWPDHPEWGEQATRKPDGVWVRGDRSPRHTRLSGVWLFRGVMPWNLASAYSCLYEHPKGDRVLPASLLSVPHAQSVNGKMEWYEGESAAQILGLQHDYLFSGSSPVAAGARS